MSIEAVFLATGTKSKKYLNLIREDCASLLKLTKIANFYRQPKIARLKTPW